MNTTNNKQTPNNEVTALAGKPLESFSEMSISGCTPYASAMISSQRGSSYQTCPYCGLVYSSTVLHTCDKDKTWFGKAIGVGTAGRAESDKKILETITRVGQTSGDKTSSAKELVNHPEHYAGEIECIDAIRAALTPEEFKGFCKGNALKYIWRAGKKGEEKQDYKKSIWYMDRML